MENGLNMQDLSQFTNGPDSSVISDEESFVVLDRTPAHDPSGQLSNIWPSPLPGSLVIQSSLLSPNIMMNSDSDRPTFVEKNNSSLAMGSFSTDVSPEEIQKRLNDVLQENVSLKETLYQNNLAMKQQLMTLGTWQEEVAKLHQNHKEKFAETKDLILKLRVENDELKKKALTQFPTVANEPSPAESALIAANTTLTIQVADLQREVATLCLKNEQYLRGSKKEQELFALTEQLNRQLETAERSRRQLDVDVERLHAQNTRLERETASLNVDMEIQKQRIAAAEMENKALMQCSDKGQEVDNLKAQLKEQQDMIDKMISQQQSQPSAGVELAKELKKHNRWLEEISSDFGKQADTCTSLNSWLHLATENVDKLDDSATVVRLQTEIADVRRLLADEHKLGEQRSIMLSEAQEQFKNLFSDYQKILHELEMTNKIQSSKDQHKSSYHDVQVRGFTEKIDSMTAQIMNLEEDLLRRNQLLSETRLKMKELEADNETIPVLQIQMQVYQSDFNAEREARENLAGEKERLAEDLRLLQRRNQQLLNELKLYQQNYSEQLQQQSSTNVGNGWTTISTPGRNHPRENTPPSPGPFDQ